MKGIIFDIDGTLMVDDKVLDGAIEVIEKINKQKIPFCFVTNTTEVSTQHLFENLLNKGFIVRKEQIITPIVIAKKILNSKGVKSIQICYSEDLKQEFSEYEFNEKPEVVIISDDGTGLTNSQINQIFQYFQTGSELIVLQNTKYYKKEGKLVVDLGFYSAGFEYITGKKIQSCGKPSKLLFDFALQQMRLSKSEDVYMVGDDIEFDILGSQKLGFKGFLVKTGKYFAGIENQFNDKPFQIIESVKNLLNIF